MKQTNFHTHTSRCHHAFGNDEEFVRTAIQNGFEVLGFSDHACWKYDSDFVAHMRMKLDEFDDYKDSVLYLKDRYKKQIEIRFGLEAEYFPKYMDWLLDFCIENEIPFKASKNSCSPLTSKLLFKFLMCIKFRTPSVKLLIHQNHILM